MGVNGRYCCQTSLYNLHYKPSDAHTNGLPSLMGELSLNWNGS